MSFWRNGYTSFIADTSSLDVSHLRPTQESGKYGSDLTQTFTLSSERQPETTLNVTDSAITKFFETLLPRRIPKHIIFHNYSLGTEMNWHHDVFDRASVLALVYLTPWSAEFGGMLQLGKCRIDARGFPTNIPELIVEFCPDRGRVVLINNLDPTLLHRVTAVTADKRRQVLSCQYF